MWINKSDADDDDDDDLKHDDWSVRSNWDKNLQN